MAIKSENRYFRQMHEAQMNKCICERMLCTSCQACVKSCIKNNIRMVKEISGFSYAVIDDCTCHECNFICPQLKPIKADFRSRAFALQLKDKKQLLKSTSGGAFSALSKHVFSYSGVVFGAVYDEHLCVKHIIAENMLQMQAMHGSKYIQSDISDCYQKINQQLANDRIVLFCGLPCQVAGILAFLGHKHDNLITVDLICSGVPSQKLFTSYINYLEEKFNIKVIDFKFRDKAKYGTSHTTVITYINRLGNKKVRTIKHRDLISYYVAFGKQNCYMNACYNCRYNKLERVSDFTIGGFWSIRMTGSLLNKHDGVSLVLANSNESISTLMKLNEIAFIEEYPIDVAVIENEALFKTTPKELQDEELYFDLNDYGYSYVRRKHLGFSRKYICIRIIKHLYQYLSSNIRNILGAN